MSRVESSASSSSLLAQQIFPAGGEMGQLCRDMDWAATPLGPIELWPQSLRTAAGMVVAQGIAQSLCWGPEGVQVYNDAYRLVMRDKHPEGLGRSVMTNWSEIRADIEPLFERVFSGETVYFEDLPFRVERDGVVDDAFFTFSYSPVHLESGAVGGLLINCFETTQQVHSRAVQAERDRLFESLEFEQSRLEFVFQNAPAFLAVLRGKDYTFDLVNRSYHQLVGHRDLVGKPLLEALPEIAGQGFVELLDQVMATGEPFFGSEMPATLIRKPGAAPEQVFVDLSYLPFVEPDGSRTGVIAHGYDVTEQVRARRQVELLLKESEESRRALESVNERLEMQGAELQAVNVMLQENAAEMEAQTDELQNTASALEERTEEAELSKLEADRARAHLARVIEQAPVAMYIATGREHVFEVVNAGYYTMVGKSPSEIIGRPGREVFPELVPQGVFDIIESVYDSGVPFQAKAIPAEFDTDNDGVPEVHYFNLVYQPLVDARNDVYAIALVATEVTELVQARDEAEAARREAEVANRAKADFLASMSHELRTPLNAIGGYTDLLEIGIHGPMNEGQLQALARVKAGQQHLLVLINDILAFARIEAGRIEFDTSPLVVLQLAADVKQLVSPLAEAKNITLTTASDDGAAVVLADPERTRQILLNVVGNAIKFTQSGGKVHITWAKTASRVEIAVHDNGPGIPTENQHTIFDPFVQLGRGLSNPRDGVGLGLAISRDLARSMKGDLTVVSQPGEGSTFTLSLPTAQ